MSTDQIKSEISKALDEVPEDLLRDILQYLKEIKGKPPGTATMAHFLRQIMNEDRELLSRLSE